VRQGFRWWEYDPTFYVLKALSAIGVVWDLKSPPLQLLRGNQRLGRRMIEKVAGQLAASFPVNAIASQALAALPPNLPPHLGWTANLRAHVASARSQAEAFLANTDIPPLPTLDDVRAYARARLANSPSIEEIAVCARQRLLELVYVRMCAEAAAVPEGTAR